MLRLQTKAIAFLVNLSAFACDAAVQEIARVKLNAGFGRVDFHHSPARGFVGSGRERKTARAVIKHPVVIVTSA